MVQFVTVYFDVEDQLSFADNPYLLDVILTPKSLLALHTLSATRASRSSGDSASTTISFPNRKLLMQCPPIAAMTGLSTSPTPAEC